MTKQLSSPPPSPNPLHTHNQHILNPRIQYFHHIVPQYYTTNHILQIFGNPSQLTPILPNINSEPFAEHFIQHYSTYHDTTQRLLTIDYNFYYLVLFNNLSLRLVLLFFICIYTLNAHVYSRKSSIYIV